MNVLSFHAWWAYLAAAGLKKIETRGWYTSYRGPLGIHVSKGMPAEFRPIWAREPFTSALYEAGYVVKPKCPGCPPVLDENRHKRSLGKVIAICDLVDCKRITKATQLQFVGPSQFVMPGEPERSFGNYTPGRFAWYLENVKLLPDPVPARGALGLWEFELPKDLPGEIYGNQKVGR